MAENWIPYGEVEVGKPTEVTEAASSHKNRNQVLLIEKWDKPNKDIFSVIIVSKDDLENLIACIGRFEQKSKAKKKAEEWMNKNEDGV